MNDLKSLVEKRAEEYEAEFHKQYPKGMTVADYCNAEVPSVCFTAGALDPLITKAIMLEERAKVLREAYDELDDFTYFGSWKFPNEIMKAESELRELLEGGNK